MALKIADQVWLGAALLTREQPERRSFRPKEIIERVALERFTEVLPPGVQVHVSQHAVANLPANPGRYRMLVATPNRERRLFRAGDPYHPTREGSKVIPSRDDIPENYWDLLDWYEREYSPTTTTTAASENSELLRVIDAAIDQLVAEVQIGTLGTFWSEHAIAAAHWSDLRSALRDRRDVEAHLELSIGGGRARPDVAVIPAQEPWVDRQEAGAIYAAEFKSFADWGLTAACRLSDVGFSSLLEQGGSSLLAEFERLAQLVEKGLLAGGLVMWRDCFDWRQRVRDADRLEVIEERRQWVRNRLQAPGIRVEYIPVLFPPGVSIGRLGV